MEPLQNRRRQGAGLYQSSANRGNTCLRASRVRSSGWRLSRDVDDDVVLTCSIHSG